MYIVIEIQTLVSGQIATIVTTHNSYNVAEQKYHTILAAAAVSGLPCHAAAILSPSGAELKHQCYTNGEE